METRSGKKFPSSDNGYQHQHYNQRLLSASDNLSAVSSTLGTMKEMLDGLTANTEFEKGVKSYLALLHSQVCEARAEHSLLREEQARLRDEMLVRNRNVRDSIDDLALNVVKTEQYSRRDTVTIVGLTKPDGTETETQLCEKVADVLSASGVTVTADDLSVAHRNSKNNRTVKGKIVPPSITARFAKISKKDAVLRSYKNYDSAKSKPRDVKVYQSLTPHYSTVRKSIYDFFNSESDSTEFGYVCNRGLKVKWVTYQSPTSGFAIKLQSGEYFNGIHLFSEFLNLIHDKFEACRIK